MRMLCTTMAVICFALPAAADDKLSPETDECIDCHEEVTPGIVEDWKRSRHSDVMPVDAMDKSRLKRRMSARTVPARFRNVVVGCFECHGQNTEAHTDSFEHFGYEINIVVSPNDCKTCFSD